LEIRQEHKSVIEERKQEVPWEQMSFVRMTKKDSVETEISNRDLKCSTDFKR